jgi:hypothetical protein
LSRFQPCELGGYNDHKMDDEQARLQQLESQLQLITENFEREMRARGFDPVQADNVALPAPLADLYLQQQSLMEQIEEIREGTQ